MTDHVQDWAPSDDFGADLGRSSAPQIIANTSVNNGGNGHSPNGANVQQVSQLDDAAAQAIARALGFDTPELKEVAEVIGVPAPGSTTFDDDAASAIAAALGFAEQPQYDPPAEASQTSTSWFDFDAPVYAPSNGQPVTTEPAVQHQVTPEPLAYTPDISAPSQQESVEDDSANLLFRALWQDFAPSEPQPVSWDPAETVKDDRLFEFVPPKHETTRSRIMAGVKITARSLLRERRRLILSVIAVAIGVGYLAGSLTLLRRVGNGLAAQVGSGSETADLVIEGSISLDTPLEQVRRLVPASLADTVAAMDGVAAVEPRLEATAIVIGAEGDAVVGLGLTERPVGLNWPVSDELNNYDLLPGGSPPRAPTDVVLDTVTAVAAGVVPGDNVTIATKTTTSVYTVVGLVDLGDSNTTQGTTVAFFETETAKSLFELNSDANAIAIAVEPGVETDELRATIASMLPVGAEITDGETYSEHRVTALAKSFTLIRSLLIGFAALALIVGAFSVANSMALLFEHRRRGFAMLRLLGASKQQLMGAAATEALIAGLVAGVLGLGLGLAVGWGIEKAIAQMSASLPVAGSAVGWQIPLIAVSVGGAITLLTSLAPARAAAATAPIHAITLGESSAPLFSIGQRVWMRLRRPLLVAAAVGFGTFFVTSEPSYSFIAFGASLVVALIAAQLPRALSGVVSIAIRAALAGAPALRRASSLKSEHARRRIAATTAALLMATAVVTGLAILSSSFVQSIDGQVSGAITADLVVDSGTISHGGLPSDLLPALREIDGVEGVSGLRVGRASVQGLSIRIGAMDGASAFDLLNLGVIGDPPDGFGEREMALSSSTAEATGLSVGDSADVLFENGSFGQLSVIAVYETDLSSILGDAIIETELLARELPQSVDILAFVGLGESADDQTIASIEDKADEFGAKGVLDPDELVSNRVEFLRGFAKVIQWMLAFTVLLALIGVANTLQLGVNERRKELGLLRAIGASRQQVLRIVMSEATAMSLTGTAIGMAAGAGIAFGTVKGLSQYGLTDFVVPVIPLVAIAAFAIGFGLLGAVIPALIASRIPILEAVSDQIEKPSEKRPLFASDRLGTRVLKLTVAGLGLAGIVALTFVGVSNITGADSLISIGVSMAVLGVLASVIAGIRAIRRAPSQPLVPTPVERAPTGEESAAASSPEPPQSPKVQPVEPASETATTIEVDDGKLGEAEHFEVQESGEVETDEDESETEVAMAMRCMECGEDPGIGSTCQACGKTQTVSAGMFSVSPGAGGQPKGSDTPDPQPSKNGTYATSAQHVLDEETVDAADEPSTYSTASAASRKTERPLDGFDEEIADAEIIDDVEVPLTTETARAASAAAAESASSEPLAGSQPLGSIFQERPSGNQAQSPFGRHANDPAPTPPGRYSTTDPLEEELDREVYTPYEPATPEPEPPASFGSGANTQGRQYSPSNDSNPPIQDHHGLAAAISSLAKISQSTADSVWMVVGALLQRGETVEYAVSGVTLGMQTAAVSTNRRVLVVSERRWLPEIEIFELSPDLAVHGRHVNGLASLTFSQAGRVVTVDQIRDVNVAVALAETVAGR